MPDIRKDAPREVLRPETGTDGGLHPLPAPKPPVSEAARVKWSAVVINFNGDAQLVRTIDSLRATATPPEEIIVVDDGSTDRSLDLVRDACPDVRIVTLGRNTARTGIVRNAGLKAAQQRFVLVTDNDIRFAPDAVRQMMKVMLDREDAAACTPVVYYDDRPDEVFLRGHRLHYLCWSCRPDDPEDDRPTISVGCGIQLLDRDSVLGLGGFDENLHIGWGDDGELHHRLRIAGMACYSTPLARVFHARERFSQRRFGQVHNRVYMLAKCYSPRTLLVLAPALIAFEAFLALYMLATGFGREYLRAVGEVWDRRSQVMADRRILQARRRCPDRGLLAADSIALSLRRGQSSAVLDLMGAAFRQYWNVARMLLR